MPRKRVESTKAKARQRDSTPDTQLAAMIVALTHRIRSNKVGIDALNDIARLFAYEKHFEDVDNRAVHSAINDFNAACIHAYGHVQENVTLRFRKGTVRGEDLQHLYRLPALQ